MSNDNESAIGQIIANIDQAEANLDILRNAQGEDSDENNEDAIRDAQRLIDDLRATVEDIVP